MDHKLVNHIKNEKRKFSVPYRNKKMILILFSLCVHFSQGQTYAKVSLFNSEKKALNILIERNSSKLEDNLNSSTSQTVTLSDLGGNKYAYQIGKIDFGDDRRIYPYSLINSFILNFDLFSNWRGNIINQKSQIRNDLINANPNKTGMDTLALSQNPVSIYDPEAFLNSLFIPYLSLLSPVIENRITDTTFESLISHYPDSTIAKSIFRVKFEGDSIRIVNTINLKLTRFARLTIILNAIKGGNL